METVYTKQSLQTHLELIKPAGFTLESFEDEFFFSKQEAHRKITIMLHYDDYFPHDVVFHGISLSILFYNVEQILNTVYLVNPISDFNHTINESNTFDIDFREILSQIDKYQLESTQVADNQTFNLVVSHRPTTSCLEHESC